MKVRILRCEFEEFIGAVVEVYYDLANGIVFIAPDGMIFVSDGDYEEV